MMTYISQRGVTLPSTDLDILFSVASNHSLVHTFTALFCFGLSYCECGFSFQLRELVMEHM